MMSRRSTTGSSGFSLPELLVIAATLVVLTSISFPTLVRFYEAQKLLQAAVELQSWLLNARALGRRTDLSCIVSFSAAGATARVFDTTTSTATATSCSPDLRLNSLTSVSGLCLSNNGSTGTACAAPSSLIFTPLGVISGAGATVYVASAATPVQYCVDVRLTLIRVGSRNNSIAACNYTLI